MQRTLLGWLAANPILAQVLYVSALIVLSWLVYLLTNRLILGTIRRIIARTRTTWDDALVSAEVFGRLGHLPAALVAYYGAAAIPDLHEGVAALIQRVAFALVVVAIVLSLGGLFTAANAIYARNPENRDRPIKG